MRLPPEDWYIVRTITLERDGYRCQYCGSARRLHVDHKIPLIRGGSNGFENLVTSCGPFNQSKGPKMLGDWVPPRLRPIEPSQEGGEAAVRAQGEISEQPHHEQ